jgi:hypothetical protein
MPSADLNMRVKWAWSVKPVVSARSASGCRGAGGGAHGLGNARRFDVHQAVAEATLRSGAAVVDLVGMQRSGPASCLRAHVCPGGRAGKQLGTAVILFVR